MSYTLEGIRKRVLIDKLDDEDFDSSVVDGFINDAQRDIFSEYTLEFTEAIFQGSLPTAGSMFNFPSDVSAIRSFVVSDGTTARNITDKYISFDQFNELYPAPEVNQAGRVEAWTLYGGRMITSRPTDMDYVMTIYYNKVPKTLLADQDIPELPQEFEELLVLGAFYRVQFREGDSDEALVTKSEYQRKLEQMASRYGFRVNSGPIRMGNRQVNRWYA